MFRNVFARLYEFSAKIYEFFLWKLRKVEQRLFDLYMKTSTTGVQLVSQDFFKSGSENWFYQGCDWYALHRVLRELQPNSDDFFVDIGSGKGKALLVAGRLPYGKVVGVELDPDLAAHARRNIEAARSKFKASLVETEIANALDWPIPKQASTIFMFNPFFGETFRSVIGKIFESYDENPRPLHIIYLYPWEHDWLVSTGRVVVDNVSSGGWPKRVNWWKVGVVAMTYHVVGAGEAASTPRCLPHAMSPTSKAMLRWNSPNGYKFTIQPPSAATSEISSRPLVAAKEGDSVVLNLTIGLGSILDAAR